MSFLFDRASEWIDTHRADIGLGPDHRWIGPSALFVIVAVIGLADYLTGPLWSMSVFYLVPTSLGTLLAGRRLGLVLAALSGVSNLLCDVVLQPGYHHRAVAAWNVAFMVVTLIVVVELIHRSRQRALAAPLRAEERGRDFLAAAAHQLRTPLAGIRSTADALMMAPDLDSSQQGLLAVLVRETDRGGRLVRSLLRVARLDQNEPLPFHRVDLARLVSEEVSRSAAAWRPELQWSIDEPDLPVLAACNADAVSEAVANLLDNAHRHAHTRVSLTVRHSGGDAEIVVADDGPGLPPDSIDAAFRRFVSLDGCGGTGLGLPIAQGIADAHGGTLQYEDRSFVLRFPIRAYGWMPALEGEHEAPTA